MPSVETGDWIPQKSFQSNRKAFLVCKLEAVGKNPRTNANASKRVDQVEFTEADEFRKQLKRKRADRPPVNLDLTEGLFMQPLGVDTALELFIPTPLAYDVGA